jgi:hypothetical protein
MKKIAMFVEGQTEQIFAAELLKRIFTQRKISIESLQFSGKMGSRKMTIIKTTIAEATHRGRPCNGGEYYFRIYDCHGGGENSTVKSDIIEQLASLRREGFANIIGIRDVYPALDICLLRKMLGYGIPQTAIPVSIVLAVNEIEAWFVAENKHYKKISPFLTIGIVNKTAAIDVEKDSTEILPHPAETLNNIYHKVGCAYRKRKYQIERTVSALNYENLYFNVRTRNNSLNELLTALEQILA